MNWKGEPENLMDLCAIDGSKLFDAPPTMKEIFNKAKVGFSVDYGVDDEWIGSLPEDVDEFSPTDVPITKASMTIEIQDMTQHEFEMVKVWLYHQWQQAEMFVK